MSPRDFVISFFAVVKQSSFACLGKVTRASALGSAGPSFLFLLASPLMGLCQDKRTCGTASRGCDTFGCT